nr:4-hydroxy-3-methylbut-2-enyl diphosphate reductase [Desulfobacterales bacterium]
MKIKLARTAGFCMGVRRAVEMVLDAANTSKGDVYTFGPLIHNPQVLDILKKKGVTVLDDHSCQRPGIVLIRAHGVPPETKKRLNDAGHRVIDATCPRVIRVQTIIQKYARSGYNTLIVGDPDHPETIGLLGYAEGRGHVIRTFDELTKLPTFEKAIVVAQTTQDTWLFHEISKEIASLWPHYKIFNTICDSTMKRQAEVEEMARMVDAMVVVGGRNSGNTKRLVQVAEHTGVRAYHVETESDLDTKDLEKMNSVGITAGASTPNWVIRKVYRTLESLPFQKKGGWRNSIFKIQRCLILSNIYVALGAGCLSFTCALLQGIRPSITLALTATFYVLSMHILNKFTVGEAIQYNDPDKAVFYERNKTLLLSLALSSGVAGLVIALSFGLIPFLILFTMSILGVLYNVKLTPGRVRIRGSFQRIKDIPGSKTVLIATAWGIVTAFLPGIIALGKITLSLMFVSLWAIIMVFVRTALFDILDIQGDRIVGQETLPIVFGEDKTMSILKVLLLVFLVALPLAYPLNIATTLSYPLIPCTLYMGGTLLIYEQGWMIPGLQFEFLVETSFVFAGLISLGWWFLL